MFVRLAHPMHEDGSICELSDDARPPGLCVRQVFCSNAGSRDIVDVLGPVQAIFMSESLPALARLSHVLDPCPGSKLMSLPFQQSSSHGSHVDLRAPSRCYAQDCLSGAGLSTLVTSCSLILRLFMYTR